MDCRRSPLAGYRLLLLLFCVAIVFCVCQLMKQRIADFALRLHPLARPAPSAAHAHAHATAEPGSRLEAEKDHFPSVSVGTATDYVRNASREGGGGELEPESKLFYTTAVPEGRLGNHMFQYASLLGIAATNGRLPGAFHPRDSLAARTFSLTYVSHRSARGFRHLAEIGSGTYDPQFEKLPRENVRLSTFLQSWKYFQHIESVIRAEFTFPPLAVIRARRQLTKQTKGRGNVTTVGVHVRRGDYAEQKIVGQFQTPPPSYFEKAADYFRAKYHDVIFVVVTADKVWCQRLLNLKGFVIADDAPAVEHLSLLTECDHVIVSLGTFGWWGGYLGGGDVVYYSNCVYPNITAKKSFTAADTFRPMWVGIGD